MSKMIGERSEPGGPNDRLLSWPKVKDISGLSRTTAWRRIKAGDFPLAVQISPGRVGWWESEMIAWKASRAHRSRSNLPAFPTNSAPPPMTSIPKVALIKIEPSQTPPKPPESRTVRRRRTTTNEGQIAFEF